MSNQNAAQAALKSLKIKKIDATLIKKAGDYVMAITNFEFINSFEKNFNHELKDNLTELIEQGKHWCDPTPQIAVTLGDKDGQGVITHRFNAKGYLQKDDPEVSKKMLDKDNIMVIGKYVCQQSDEGWERIEAPEKTESALRMLFTFLNKLGFTDEEMDVVTALERAMKDKYYIVVTVDEEEYEGKDRLVITKFSRAKLEDIEADEEAEVSSKDF
jgi:hypothetical protein